MENAKGYKTADTALAAYLLYKGMKILGTIPHETDPKRKVYVFVDGDLRDAYVEEYLTGQDQVSASQYHRKYREAMRYLYED